MEDGESRNKRYVNPRNGAVYSSHKKTNKIFFRSERYTPRALLYAHPALPFATPRLLLTLPTPPEKWQRINRRWDKECETRLGMESGTSFALRFPVIRLPDDGFSEAERNRSTYCPELISRLPRPRTNGILFSSGIASCAIHPHSPWFSVSTKEGDELDGWL